LRHGGPGADAQGVEMPTPKLRVLIADDHVPTRTALRENLQEGGIEVCAEAGTGAQAIDAALSSRPDVCLIDMRMPDDGGIIATEAIRQALPSAKIVLMTATPDEEGALAAACTGADGYLDKNVDPRRLPQVVKAVAAGQAAYPRRLTHSLLRAIRQANQERLGN
jgi:two-component system, NarL family, nitrate/nitrite response regulator NarL